MGEDVVGAGGLSRDGADGEQRLAATLRQTSAVDPDLLAQVIYHYAQPDIEAQNIGLESELTKLRGPLLKAMLELRASAESILGTTHATRQVGALEYAIADLAGGSEDLSQHGEVACRYLQLLVEIAEIPLVSDLSAFATKPELDWPTTRVVAGVLGYCSIKAIFGGVPKSEQADKKYTNPIKTEPAKLVVEVLKSMGIQFDGKQIATHMKKASQIIKQWPF